MRARSVAVFSLLLHSTSPPSQKYSGTLESSRTCHSNSAREKKNKLKEEQVVPTEAAKVPMNRNCSFRWISQSWPFVPSWSNHRGQEGRKVAPRVAAAGSGGGGACSFVAGAFASLCFVKLIVILLQIVS
uniref:Uncharacterized protein n=1 Tax=Amblyomma americanum TaxID=6943 RepID=A0A0C9SEX3_AMBAM